MIDEVQVETQQTTREYSSQPPVRTEPPQQIYEKKKVIFRAYQVIWYILGVIEVLLAFRVVLKLVGANPASGFTAFIYAVSGPFAIPFLGILPTARAANSVFEWSTLIGMAVYAIVAWGIVKLFQFMNPATPEEVHQTVDSQ